MLLTLKRAIDSVGKYMDELFLSVQKQEPLNTVQVDQQSEQ